MSDNPYVATAKHGAKQIERFFKSPDDDWVPMLMVVNSEGEVAVVDVIQFFENDASKRVFAEVVLPMMVEDMDARRLVLVTSSWIIGLSKEQFEAGYVRPSENPERVEVLIISDISPEGVSIHHAPISRDPRGASPPTLGEWEVFDSASGATAGGQIVEHAAKLLADRKEG